MAATRTRLEPDLRRGEILAAARRVFARATTPTPRWRRSPARPASPAAWSTTTSAPSASSTWRSSPTSPRSCPGIVRTDLGDLPIERIVELNLARFLDAVERDFELWSILLGAGAARARPRGGGDRRLAPATRSIERMARNHAGADAGEELRLALRAFLGAADRRLGGVAGARPGVPAAGRGAAPPRPAGDGRGRPARLTYSWGRAIRRWSRASSSTEGSTPCSIATSRSERPDSAAALTMSAARS